MWRYRSKSTRKDNKNDNVRMCRTPSNPDFNHQSFKDIETLFPKGGDNNFSDLNSIQEQPSSSSPNFSTTAANSDVGRHSIFHRVRLANRFTRAFSARPKPDPEDILSELNKIAAAEKSGKPEKPENCGIYEKPGGKPEITVTPEKSENSDKSMIPDKPEKSLIPEKPEKLEKSLKSEPPIPIPGADKRVVVYMTSLRAVRPTFEACRTVRSILDGFRVPVDERDLSMDISFLTEIKKIMTQIEQSGGERLENSKVTLPRVFIGGRYIGGVDEIVELHEIGELKKLVAGLPAATPGVCNICGGFRFILCYECNGSHKCHLEDGGFRTCTACNENGLIRCPSCLTN